MAEGCGQGHYASLESWGQETGFAIGALVAKWSSNGWHCKRNSRDPATLVSVTDRRAGKPTGSFSPPNPVGKLAPMLEGTRGQEGVLELSQLMGVWKRGESQREGPEQAWILAFSAHLSPSCLIDIIKLAA